MIYSLDYDIDYTRIPEYEKHMAKEARTIYKSQEPRTKIINSQYQLEQEFKRIINQR